MLEDFNIKNDEIIPVCVVATMSSGKSTFLNAILGEEVLPEKNEACTARALAVLNYSNTQETMAFIEKNDGTKFMVDLYYSDTVTKINADENVKNVLIVKDIKTMGNTHKPIVLVDTPGVNNSGDIRHAERTKEVLDGLKKGVIVYLLNATQLATNDDELLLQTVIDHIKKNKKIKIVFVLNKIDMLDEDKESIPSTISNAVQYIRDHGLQDFTIFPLSALSAKTFRLKLNNRRMTKAEERHLEQNFPEYQDNGMSMLRYANSYNQNAKSYVIGQDVVSEYSLRRAIENTGIVEIERQIQYYVNTIEKKEIQEMRSLMNYPELEGVYSKVRRTRNYENYKGKMQWICKNCKQVNGEKQECLHCSKPNVKWRKVNS